MNAETLSQNEVELHGSEQFSETTSARPGNRVIIQPEEIVQVRTNGANGYSAKSGAPEKNRRRHLVAGITALVAALAMHNNFRMVSGWPGCIADLIRDVHVLSSSKDSSSGRTTLQHCHLVPEAAASRAGSRARNGPKHIHGREGCGAYAV